MNHTQDDLQATALIQQEDDSCTTDFLSKLTLDYSPRPRKKATLGQRMRRRLLLSSAPKIPSFDTSPSNPLKMSKRGSSLPSPVVAKSSSLQWGNDSTSTEATLNCSIASMGWDDQYETVQQEALSELDLTLQQVQQDKVAADQTLQAAVSMARARLASGCEMGAVVSMRKVHAAQTTKAYLAAARFQLTALRKEICNNNNSSSNSNANEHRMAVLDGLRQRAKDIVVQAHQAKNPTPSDEALLVQLRRIVDLDDCEQQEEEKHG